jgi:beta-galactosidase
MEKNLHHSSPRMTIGDTDFLLDGEPFRVLSGAIHYFRVHPAQWRHRIRAARGMGLNTIETYVAWNEHATRPGAFDTTGRLDIGGFLDIVQEEGMRAIVRPGPYICAEFDNGGLPGWLTSTPGIRLRRSDPLFVDAVTGYLTQVFDVVRPRQIDRGGPVILMQVENEYGAYGDDKDYLRRLADLHREHGITVPLTTIDQPTDRMLADGGLPDLLKTGSFGSRAEERLATLRRHQPAGPLMCAEFWDGWFDSWGTIHHTTDADASAAELDAILTAGASVNIYMFHGGTNGATTNGANHKGRYLPITTSYDYDAPLDEAGRPTAKYHAFREVIRRHFPDAVGGEPTEPATAAAPAFEAAFTHGAPLDDLDGIFDRPVSRPAAPSFDEIGHFRGVARYTARIDGVGAGVLAAEVRDRAVVRIDGTPVGILDRESRTDAIPVPAGRTLDLLVEDQGRVNYGPRLGEPKGLIGAVRIGATTIADWEVRPIDLDAIPGADLPTLPATDIAGAQVLRAEVLLDEPADLFLDTAGWGKGFAWFNDAALGRYWRRGPQRTLYVPGPATVAGANVLTVLELEAMPDRVARFLADHDLGPTEE